MGFESESLSLSFHLDFDFQWTRSLDSSLKKRHDRNSRGPNFSRRGGAQSSGRAIVKGLLLIKESRKRRLNLVNSRFDCRN